MGMRGVRGQRGRINGRALVGYMFLTAGIVAALVRGEQNDGQLCESAQENRQILRTLIQQGDPMAEDANGNLTLRLKPGDPAYDYFIARPKEAKAAHVRNQRVLSETVPPIDC